MTAKISPGGPVLAGGTKIFITVPLTELRLRLAACVVNSPLFTVVGIYMTLAVDITDGCGLLTKSVLNSCQRRAR